VIGGSKVVVRSIARGSPKGGFMGLELDGSKSFRIDTTDIHELDGGQIIKVHHLEDWATAIKQLSAQWPMGTGDKAPHRRGGRRITMTASAALRWLQAITRDARFTAD